MSSHETMNLILVTLLVISNHQQAETIDTPYYNSLSLIKLINIFICKIYHILTFVLYVLVGLWGRTVPVAALSDGKPTYPAPHHSYTLLQQLVRSSSWQVDIYHMIFDHD